MDPIYQPLETIPELDINKLMMAHIDANPDYWLIKTVCCLIELFLPRCRQVRDNTDYFQQIMKRKISQISNVLRGSSDQGIVYDIMAETPYRYAENTTDTPLSFSALFTIQPSQAMRHIEIFFGIREIDQYPFYFARERVPFRPDEGWLMVEV